MKRNRMEMIFAIGLAFIVLICIIKTQIHHYEINKNTNATYEEVMFLESVEGLHNRHLQEIEKTSPHLLKARYYPTPTTTTKSKTMIGDNGELKPIPTTTTTTVRPTAVKTTTRLKTEVITTTATEALAPIVSETTKPVEQTSGNYLYNIKNANPNYQGSVVKVADRNNLERLVSAEFGTSYAGSVMVAQAIRDSMQECGVYDPVYIKQKYGYTVSLNRAPTANAKKAVAYVFDQGGSGVQHSVYVFYASNICKSSWHETQKFLIQIGHVRFFARR